jgi:hypothetical protein
MIPDDINATNAQVRLLGEQLLKLNSVVGSLIEVLQDTEERVCQLEKTVSDFMLQVKSVVKLPEDEDRWYED